MPKNIYILGINTSHDRSACLLKDGKVCVAIAEERLDRIKHSILQDEKHNVFSLLPKKAISYCLNYEGIDINTVDLIVASSALIFHPKRMPRNPTKSIIGEQLPLLKNPNKIAICNHHLSHAASAFWASPFKESAILVADWGGNILKNNRTERTSIFAGRGNNVRLVKKITSCGTIHNSLGEMYSLATYFIGFGPFGEGKTMGLAPYGDSTYVKYYDNGIKYLGGGEYRVGPDFQFSEKSLISERYKKLFGLPRTDGSPIRKVDKDIAFAVQKKLEEILINLFNYAYERTKYQNICIAGGVGLNCTVNGKILDKTPFKNVFIQPAASDEGCALGNALYGWHGILNKPKRFTMNNAYLGRVYTETEISQEIEKWKKWVRFRASRDIAKEIAKFISQGKIIGWFQGGSEVGPRALGHRSILADPRDPLIKDRLNEKVKFRESFRPYAASVLKERAAKYFNTEGDSPFMLMAVRVKDSKNIPAVTHVDGTSRIQTVTKKGNGIFYDLINEFYKLTGVPVVLNTSFNKKEEPIVETPQDAIKCFLTSDMDYLVLQNYILHKKMTCKNNKNAKLLEKYISRSNKAFLVSQGEKDKFIYNVRYEGPAVWKIDPKILKAPSKDERVVLNLKKGLAYRLAELEFRIWEMSDGLHKVKDIIRNIMLEFDVDRGSVTKDILSFVRKMSKEDLFELSNMPETPSAEIR